MTTRPVLAHAPTLAFALSFAVVLVLGGLVGGGGGPAPIPLPIPPALAQQQIQWQGFEGTLPHAVAGVPVDAGPNAGVSVAKVRSPDKEVRDSDLVEVCVRPLGNLRMTGKRWQQGDPDDGSWCARFPSGTDVRFVLEEDR